MKSEISVELSRSKTGIPCLWESGGSFTNTGSVELIADGNGKAKKPLFIRDRGDLACKEHALIPVQIGDLIFRAERHRDFVSYIIYKIDKIEDKYCYAHEVIDMAQFQELMCDSCVVIEDPVGFGGEYIEVDHSKHSEVPLYHDFIAAGLLKLHDYHCRQPYYVKFE